jgi:hypothetical protein
MFAIHEHPSILLVYFVPVIVSERNSSVKLKSILLHGQSYYRCGIRIIQLLGHVG